MNNQYPNPSRTNPLGMAQGGPGNVSSYGDSAQEAQPMSELEKQMKEIEGARSLLEFGARRIENPELAAQMSIAVSLNRLANWFTRSSSEPRAATSSPKKNEW